MVLGFQCIPTLMSYAAQWPVFLIYKGPSTPANAERQQKPRGSLVTGHKLLSAVGPETKHGPKRISTLTTLLEKCRYYPAQPLTSHFLSPVERGRKSLLEHNQSYLSACSISRSRAGRHRRGTVLHITMSSIKPGIVSKTDVLAPSHLLQPLTRRSDLL